MILKVGVITAASRVVSLVVLVLAVRLYSVDDVAYFTWGLAVTAVASPLLSLGLGRAVIASDSVADAATRHRATSSSVLIAMLMIGSGLLAWFWLAQLGNGELGALVSWCSSIAARSLTSGVLRALDRPVISAVIEQPLFPVLTAAALLAASPHAVTARLELMNLVGLTSAFTVVLGLGTCLALQPRPRLQLPDAALLVSGGRFTVVEAGTLLSAQLVAIIGPAFTTSAQYARYAIVLRYTLALSFPLDVLTGVIPTEIARARSSGSLRAMESRLRQTASAAFAAALLSVPLVAVAAYVGLPPARSGASVIIGILVLGQLVNVWTGSASLLLAFAGHESLAAAYVWVASAAGLVSTVLLCGVGRMSEVGLCLATTIAVATKNLLSAYGARVRVGVATEASTRYAREALAAFSGRQRVSQNQREDVG